MNVAVPILKLFSLHYCLLCIYYSIFPYMSQYILVKQDAFSFKPKVKIAVSILIWGHWLVTFPPTSFGKLAKFGVAGEI